MTTAKNVVVIVMGPSGAGKTTVGSLLASELLFEFADADDYHPPANRAKMMRGIPLTDEDRAPWIARLRELVDAHVHSEASLVLACSALKSSYRSALGVNQETVRTVYLKASRELLAARLSGRPPSFFNNALLDSQLDTLEEPVDGLVLDANATPEELVRKIITWLKQA